MHMNAPNAANYFELFKGAALHGYPPAEWSRQIDLVQSPGAFGKMRPRLEAFHGPAEYSYQTAGSFRKLGALKAAYGHYSRLAGVSFNACLVNLYRDGADSVAWHADDEKDMGPVVLSVSYGSTRRFAVRCNATRKVTSFDLEHKDVLIMHPGAQSLFQHCIRKTAQPVGPRLSMTFRTML